MGVTSSDGIRSSLFATGFLQLISNFSQRDFCQTWALQETKRQISLQRTMFENKGITESPDPGEGKEMGQNIVALLESALAEFHGYSSYHYLSFRIR